MPAAVSAGLLGMREGGKRRVLVPPRLGWVEDGIGPPLPSFTAVRRLATHRKEPLLFEAELIKVGRTRRWGVGGFRGVCKVWGGVRDGRLVCLVQKCWEGAWLEQGGVYMHHLPSSFTAPDGF